MAGRVRYAGGLLRRAVGGRGGEGDRLDHVLPVRGGPVDGGAVEWHEAERDEAGVLQRHHVAGAGGAGGVCAAGADLYAGGDWEVGYGLGVL